MNFKCNLNSKQLQLESELLFNKSNKKLSVENVVQVTSNIRSGKLWYLKFMIDLKKILT